MPKRYIYVPFTEDENNFNLTFMALNWRHKAAPKGKAPELVACGEHRFELEEGCRPSIYVFGHGHDDERQAFTICNTNDLSDDPVILMDVEEIARRLKADGLTPEANAKIKLWFCNEMGPDHPRELAERFIAALGDDFKDSQTTVDYYDAVLSGPRGEGEAVHKEALFRAAPAADAEDGDRPPLVRKGRASDYRSRIALMRGKSDAASAPAASVHEDGASQDAATHAIKNGQ